VFPKLVNMEQIGWIGAEYYLDISRTGREGVQCFPLEENLGGNRSHQN
jgi:hypothetical protein